MLDPRTLIATQTSRKTIFRISDKAGRGEGKGSSLTETRNALDGVLKIVLRGVWIAIRVLGKNSKNGWKGSLG